MAKSRFASAAFWSIAGSGVQYGVVFLLLVYLAHVLTPRDFGLMATVTIGLDLGTRIARWGQAELLQQKRYRNDEALNQSFRFSLVIGAVWTVIFVIMAHPLGEIYKSPELATLTFMCAPVFLFSATSATAEAVLRREFRYDVIAFRNTISTLLGAGVAIVMTCYHFGAEALAMQRIVQTAFSAIWIWTAVDWRPTFKWRVSPVPGLAREGTNIMAGTLYPYFNAVQVYRCPTDRSTVRNHPELRKTRSYGANLIQIERVNHQGLGVEPEMFDRFYRTVMTVFKDVLGADWSAEMDAVWTRVVGELTA